MARRVMGGSATVLRSNLTAIRVKQSVAAVRAMIDALPGDLQPEVVKALKSDLKTWSGPIPAGRTEVRMDPGEIELETEMSVEVMTQDERVRHATEQWTVAKWRKLMRQFWHWAHELWRTIENKTWRNADDKQKTKREIGERVNRELEKIADDPDQWLADHPVPR